MWCQAAPCSLPPERLAAFGAGAPLLGLIRGVCWGESFHFSSGVAWPLFLALDPPAESCRLLLTERAAALGQAPREGLRIPVL